MIAEICNGIDARAHPNLYAAAGLFQTPECDRLAVWRRPDGGGIVRAEPLRRLHGLLRKGDSGAGGADLCLAGLELEAGALADCVAGGARAVCRFVVRRYA